MRFLLKKAPDNFIKSVNDEISSILNRHFDNYYPKKILILMLKKITSLSELKKKKKRKKITNSSKNQNSNMVNSLDLFIFLKKLILKKQKLNLNTEF